MEPWKWGLDKQHGYVRWIFSMDKQHGDMDMKHGNAGWTWTCSMGVDMQHRHGRTAWKRTINMEIGMDVHHLHRMAMQYLHGHAARAWA